MHVFFNAAVSTWNSARPSEYLQYLSHLASPDQQRTFSKFFSGFWTTYTCWSISSGWVDSLSVPFFWLESRRFTKLCYWSGHPSWLWKLSTNIFHATGERPAVLSCRTIETVNVVSGKSEGDESLFGGLPIPLGVSRLPREVVDTPSLETPKVRLDGAPSTWWSCGCLCSLQGSWTRWSLPTQNDSVIWS